MEIKNSQIINIVHLNETHFWLEMTNCFSEICVPGQFLNLKIEHCFLRRPFSIASASEDLIGLLVQKKGSATNILSKTKAGDVIDIVGPLGNGFPVKEKWGKYWLIGGGTGIAPLLFFTKTLANTGKEVSLFYGAMTKTNIFPSLLPKGSYSTVYATEDGSCGHKGNVCDLLEKELSQNNKPDVIIAGGPVGMLKKISEISQKFNLPAYVTMESRMACGLGVCYGCVVKIMDGKTPVYKRVCKDGPVFPAEKVVWEI